MRKQRKLFSKAWVNLDPENGLVNIFTSDPYNSQYISPDACIDLENDFMVKINRYSQRVLNHVDAAHKNFVRWIESSCVTVINNYGVPVRGFYEFHKPYISYNAAGKTSNQALRIMASRAIKEKNWKFFVELSNEETLVEVTSTGIDQFIAKYHL